MCGIAGLWIEGPTDPEHLRRRAAAMADALRHRGPDGSGVWIEPDAGLALSHRRLAIIDLSPGGAQPMLSASGRTALTYNGEIYNYRELRAELAGLGVRFRGGSDTEVLLEAWERWGARETLSRLEGMFAFAAFDRSARTLTLVRDRFGVKPLLYGTTREGLFFASELRGLEAEPSVSRDVDPAALAAYLRSGFVPAPLAILSGVRKLEPGTIATWRKPHASPELDRYWAPENALDGRTPRPPQMTIDAAADALEPLLRRAVESQMVSDVPIGALLSGGVDSSLVAAMMRKAATEVQTFTIGFEEKAWDESHHAAAVAAHLGTRHHTFMTNGRQALDLVADLAGVYDEPFADSSQIPTLLLSRMMRPHVTVALSGDGGDEAFAGYQRYSWGLRLARALSATPHRLRKAAGSPTLHRALAAADGAIRRAPGAPPYAGHKLRRVLRALSAADFQNGYRHFIDVNPDADALLSASAREKAACAPKESTGSDVDPLTAMQLWDARSYLPDDILVKTDRASMSVGLEVRVPLLDHRIWDFALGIPAARRRRGGGKAVLRAVLARHVPRPLTERPKAGFAVPLAQWLRGDLRDFAEPLLSARSLGDTQLLDAAAVRALWRDHLEGGSNHGPALWAVLMFQAWRAERARQRTFNHA